MNAHQSRRLMDIFVTRPALAVVVSLVLVLAGLQASRTIPVLQFPQIESSALVISTVYVGAPAEVVQGFVTDPIERVASTVPGIDYVDSTTQAGSSQVKVWLQLNEDSTRALTELTARLSQIRFELPAGAEDPAVSIERADRTDAVFYLNVSLGAFSRADVTDYLNRQINPLLSSISGVQSITLPGGRRPAMRVWLNPEQLVALDISAQEVATALRSNNIITAIGRSENDQQRLNLLTNATLQTVADFEQLVVKHSDGAQVVLGDIARVELGEEEGEMIARFGNQSSIYIAVNPLPGANEIAIGDQLYDLLDEINPSLPDGLSIDIAYDGTLYMRDSIREIFTTLVETILLVGIVVVVLMGSVRTALVPLVTIPISLLGATAVITLMGFSLNLLTILAIVLSVGLVVDDAIVVVENVSRYMREGKSRLQAALISSRQLLSPIIGMTITLAAVYAPIGFLSGLTGVLFKEFAFTLSVAVLISGVVAITLSPIMSAYANPEGGEAGTMTRWVNRHFDRLHHFYGRRFDTLFRWQAPLLLVALFVALLAAPLYLFSQRELAPIEDQSGISIIVEAPADASLAYTDYYMNEVADLVQTLPGYVYYWQVLQANAGFSGVELQPPGNRPSTEELVPVVYDMTSRLAGVSIFPTLFPPLPTAGRFDVELVVQANDSYENMQQLAQKIVTTAAASGRFMFVDTDLKTDLPQLKLNFDRRKIADLGLDMSAVSNQLSPLLSGNYVNRFDMNGKAYQVIPMVSGYGRADVQAVLQLPIRTSGGALIPVSDIASIEHSVAPRVLGKFQQKRSFRVYGGVLPGTTKEAALSHLEKTALDILPEHYSLDYAGESRQIRSEGNTLAGVLLVALIVVYFVLVVQFNSFRDPLVVLLGSVPLALSGALLLPFLGLTTINIYSQIGFITLVGLVAKNGILIVEFANHLQNEGYAKIDAIRGAAETRLRPVLMTTAATALGHFPLVLVTGAGAEARNSIGVILVVGMLIGTLFTLFVLPCLYLLLAKDHQKDQENEQKLTDIETNVTYSA